jgi:hypothetical protein
MSSAITAREAIRLFLGGKPLATAPRPGLGHLYIVL